VIGRSRALRSAGKALAGKWAVELVDSNTMRVTYASQWTFKHDGTVTSTNPGGARLGKWRIDLKEQQVLIEWSSTAWESLPLPLPIGDGLATGKSWSGERITLRAKRLK